MPYYIFAFIVCFLSGFALFKGLISQESNNTLITPCASKQGLDFLDSRPIEQRYVVTNLFGRLGNQMFQIAAAVAYAQEQNKTVVIGGGLKTFERVFNVRFNRYDKNDACFLPAMKPARRKAVSATLHGGGGVIF